MSDDVHCPYCGVWQEINHDDGYGYDEDRLHQQECSECGMVFCYNTIISFYYTAYRADCLNGAPHNYVTMKHFPKAHPYWVICKDCGHEKFGNIKHDMSQDA